ncbi:MAG: GNAT family N-acetyltransferase [Desulfobulbus sp.]|jgi:ribosomal-protein-alanine N-acetyltransferase
MNVKKIYLQEAHLHDIDSEYCSWYSNEDGHLDFFSGSGRVFDKETLISDMEKGRQTRRWYYYLICVNEDIRVGNIKIGPIDIKNKTSDLVCLVGNRSFCGQGIAARAIRQASALAFDRYDIRKLQGGMFASNTASIKAYLNAGWVVEGVLRGFYLVDGAAEDRICVACFNPRYFPDLSA